MLVNRNNYESFFLDYIEGRMNDEEKNGLMAFLAENPDLEKELDAFENIQILATPVSFSGKEMLKKSLSGLSGINDKNFDQYCIAKMEGDLDKSSSQLFENYLSNHPEKLKEYKLFLKTFLEPDKTIVFSEKQKLRHRLIKPIKNKLMIAVSIAASISLIIISYQFYNTYRNQNKRIYTAIHEKLKIDSLLIANILGPKEQKPVEIATETKVKSKKSFQVYKDTTPKYAALRMHKPIEIVELENNMKSDSHFIALAKRTAAPPISTIETKEGYLTIKQYASRELKKRLEIENIDIEDNLSFWKAAQTGVKQINKLTGANISLNKEYDTISNRSKVIIYTNLLSFYSSTKK